MMTIMTNQFHNTQVRTRYTPAQLFDIAGRHPSEWTTAERSLVARLRRKLCGIKGCTCGGCFNQTEINPHKYLNIMYQVY